MSTNTYIEDGYSLLTSHCIYKDEVKLRIVFLLVIQNIYNKDRKKDKKIVDEETYSDFSLSSMSFLCKKLFLLFPVFFFLVENTNKHRPHLP